MSKNVIVPLADGFEEIEAVTIIDVLRRAGLSVTIAGVGGKQITGAHGLRVEADASVENCLANTYDLVVLPGGMPGAANLAQSQGVMHLLETQREHNRLIGAICAAPAVVLGDKGFLAKEKVTAYPAFRSKLPKDNLADEPVVTDGILVTGSGPGTAMQFALELVRHMVDERKAQDLAEAMLVQ